jgi:hypothetical protein
MTCDPDDWRKERQEAAMVAESEIAAALVEAANAIRKAQRIVCDSGPTYYPDDRAAGLEAAKILGDSVHAHVLAARILDLVRTAD